MKLTGRKSRLERRHLEPLMKRHAVIFANGLIFIRPRRVL